MEELHLSEIRQLKKIFREGGFRDLDDRLNVVDAFFATEEHLTPARLREILAERGFDYPEEFVLETLEQLYRFGFAHRKEFAGGPRYEHRHLDDHHDHLICISCGRIDEFRHPELERLQRAIAREHGFKLLEHRHQLYGLCRFCRGAREGGVPLSLANPGERLKVTGFTGGRQGQARLADMGLTPGTEVEVLTSQGGPVMIACRGTRLAVGRQMAQRLTCRPVDLESEAEGEGKE